MLGMTYESVETRYMKTKMCGIVLIVRGGVENVDNGLMQKSVTKR